MMELVPPVGWADVATKRDLENMAAQLRSEMSELRADLRGEIAGLQRSLFFGMLTAQAAFAGLIIAVVG